MEITRKIRSTSYKNKTKKIDINDIEWSGVTINKASVRLKNRGTGSTEHRDGQK